MILALFEDVIDSTEEIIVNPYDFKVFQNYVMPIIRRMMEQSKEHGKVDNRGKYIIEIEADALMRHELAKNLAKIAKVGTRLLEVAQGSSIKLRHEVREKREQMRNIRDSQSLQTEQKDFLKRIATAKADDRNSSIDGALMSSSVLNNRRVTYLRNRNQSELDPFSTGMQAVGHQNDFLEDIVVPNYDAELQGLWSEIKGFIESFSGEEKNSNSLANSLSHKGSTFSKPSTRI